MPKVLYVEDDELLRMVTSLALEDAGYAVVEAHDGHQARWLLDQEGGFDFVISDISMPGGMSGLEVAQAAQAARPGCRTILVSGYATSQLPALPDSVIYLGKPFRVQDLIDTLGAAG
ncbi:response regulator [Pseudoxanthomonas sp. SGNA-20]|jgi:Response regulator containing CheY-like receiver, AAA-type ATPase, and DNA-binding domains|uniref:Response regulator containing CheY-like receiver, AAA-type ATPase, and DNA-binding domains n=1 Tax=Pseudoxanthomonas taiwanensis J19 TaxID=935569 RepID=A0A562E107_9GAMM|nr:MULTISPECIES: response regulator [Pseudoxanthomonas]RRN53715.1 response regulator [Pseudoxanthomonas sp. SGNA-20]RRN78259.1 response regulator [Pseudoxanthomonas sp. SGD-10]TWH15418.1 Response regulator containing CheY-like receiver, AAA-type ATPase, and DNA-binding domains [Pseudoxanthomonas taiwanensis J19]